MREDEVASGEAELDGVERHDGLTLFRLGPGRRLGVLLVGCDLRSGGHTVMLL